MTESAPKQEPPYGLRMPPGLKARVKDAAQRNNRSMNAEIVATLEREYPDVPVGTDLSAMMAYITAGGTADERSRRVDVVNDNLSAQGRSGVVVQLQALSPDIDSFAIQTLIVDNPDD